MIFVDTASMGIGSTAILSSAVLFWVVFFFSPAVN